RPGRDEPGSFRHPRGRIGAGRRVPHGVLGNAIRRVFSRRVHQHGDRQCGGDDPVPRRLERTAASGMAVVLHQGLRVDPGDDVDPLDLPAPALRPADDIRVGGASAAGTGQSAADDGGTETTV
ncbi:uncharacterized protein METZ01_LOCUS436005, partial [marine metagenome]